MVFISFKIYYLAFVIGCTRAYDNVALDKPTWQSNPRKVEDIFDSSNAVDGLKFNLSDVGGQCAISASKQDTATLWVNLTSIYSIHDIRIYYRTDNNVWDADNTYGRRFLGFSIYVSNTTDRNDGHLCYHDTKYNSSTIPAVVNITCLVHGQYVIYFNERVANVKYPDDKYSKFAFNEICEMEVYGCRTGYYGLNCSLSCPDKCYHCHIETGICHLCESGYQGHQCEFDCRNEYYGSNCSLPCPENCRYCHKETGVCEWCEPGYQGFQCEIVSREEETAWRLRFYSTLGVVIVAVIVNAFFIIIICLKWKRNGPKVQQTMKESCTTEANNIYDNPDGNIPGEYQELGKLGESSQYDALKQMDGDQNSGNKK